MIKSMKKIILLAGPTASGKSTTALGWARGCGGEIVNSDSMQVYGELAHLTARPTQQEEAQCPHHLYGILKGDDPCSAERWRDMALRAIEDIWQRGAIPIVVGGTGLYFKALTEGLAQIPKLPEGTREKTQSLLDTDGIEALRTLAENLDPQATAKVLGNDPQRLLRIVSVAQGTGKPLSIWQQDTHPILPATSWKGMVIWPKRENLYDRINARFADMIREGGLAEAKRIFKLDLAPDLPAMKAIGLRELAAYLNGETSLDEAIELAMRQTRRFAKRQYTWLRGQMPDWERVCI